jgi:hypothetical protein
MVPFVVKSILPADIKIARERCREATHQMQRLSYLSDMDRRKSGGDLCLANGSLSSPRLRQWGGLIALIIYKGVWL